MAKKEKRHSEVRFDWGKWVLIFLFIALIVFFLWGINKLFDFTGFVPTLDTQEKTTEQTR